jgi:hypothetical protein
VNNNIPVIYQYPVGIIAAFDTYGSYVVFTQFMLDIFGYRLDLGGACSGTDYEIICNHGEVFKFEDYRIF